MSRSILFTAIRLSARLAGVALFIAPAASALPQGPTCRVLQDFKNFGGYWPTAGVIQGKDGAFYGTTEYGGPYWLYDGDVFKMSADHSSASELYYFDGTAGVHPNGVIQFADGLLYGTTQLGGASNAGTIFKIQTDGTGFTNIVDLDGVNTGGNPVAALFEGTDGLLYGTTSTGGAYGYGTVFRMHKDGSKFAVICTFDGATLGSNPAGSVMYSSNGNYYVTAAGGGAHGDGTIVQLQPYLVVGGVIFVCTTIFDFDDANSQTGKAPGGALLQGADGYLYGSASNGGTYSNYGTLYRVKADGTGFSVLHDFDSLAGANPQAHGPLVQLADGTLYGTTLYGGSHGSGTAFKISPDGSGFADLYDFDVSSSTNGAYPWDLIAGADGNLYGTTWQTYNPYDPAYGGVLYELVFDVASWSNYGSGLTGTLGIPGFVSTANPVLGTTITLTIGNSLGTSTLGIVLAGLKEANIPYKGGTLLVSNYVAIVPMTLAFPTANINFSLPNDPSLAGLEVDLQTLETDPGAVKGTSLTPGVKLILGW